MFIERIKIGKQKIKVKLSIRNQLHHRDVGTAEQKNSVSCWYKSKEKGNQKIKLLLNSYSQYSSISSKQNYQKLVNFQNNSFKQNAHIKNFPHKHTADSISKFRIVNYSNSMQKCLQPANLKTIQNDVPILNKRKQYIKEKIKTKVKQQISDLIKRSQVRYNSMNDIRFKEQITTKDIFQASVKGLPFNKVQNKPMKTSHRSRPSFFHNDPMKKFINQTISRKQDINPEKSFTTKSNNKWEGNNQIIKSPKRRSVSNIIRMQSLKDKKKIRNIYTALGNLQQESLKESVQIKPWHYTQEY